MEKRKRTLTPKMLEYQNEEREKEHKKIEKVANILRSFREETLIPEGSYFSVTGPDIKITDSRMTKIFKRLFGDEITKEIKTPRKAYENTVSKKQCDNIIGKMTKDATCWICGIEFDNTDEGMKSVCEHILPIAQAVFFLGLYSTRKHKSDETDIKMGDKILLLEYGWAHNTCNGEKSDMLLIKEVEQNPPVWDVDVEKIEELLKKIQNSTRSDSTSLKIIIKESSGWFDERKEKMISRIKEIVNFINRTEGDESLGDLVTLAGWASFVDPDSMTPNFTRALGIEPYSKRRKTEKNITGSGKRTLRNKKW